MVARGSERWREEKWGDACATAKTTIVWIGADQSTGQKEVGLTVDRRAVPIFRAAAAVIARHRYLVDRTQTGAYNCRHIGNDVNRPWSSHAWATAVDINWRRNPDGSRLVTDMPAAMIDDLQALTCADGTPCWRWGGDWDRDPRTGHTYYDAMHFEAFATPDEIASGPICDPGAAMLAGPVFYFEGADGMAACAWMATDRARGLATASAAEAAEAAKLGLEVIAVGGPAGRTLAAAGVAHTVRSGSDRAATYRAVAN